ncbi:MAG: hypothetical protein JNL10_08525 [Verrucomicrobiales bacterium]|nr:hypothetical protein [Verrucomicrobiales bacterium]
MEPVDWAALERLRSLFLQPGATRAPYWRTRTDLASYDATAGQRIGWKWDAVLEELTSRRWTLPEGPIVDYGCGSGIAGRRVLGAFDGAPGRSLWLHDRSALAMEFARERASERFPRLEIRCSGASEIESMSSIGVLLISHVLGELPGKEQRRLVALARRAVAVIWVEPGTHADSHALVRVREELRQEFHLVAPCTHRSPCGLLAPGNEAHWCHHFARPPWEIFSDPDWAEYARRMGIDLRSLPYSYLVLDRRHAVASGDGWSRVLGMPRGYKGYSRVFSCDACGVRDLRIARRSFPEFMDALGETSGPRRVRWRTEGGDIVAIEAPVLSGTADPGPGTSSDSVA